ncbi:MAG: STAS domain-containing protein [bacterium]|nr:STAS domain-containing protein [bacterium]
MQVNRSRLGVITFFSPDAPLVGENMSPLDEAIDRCINSGEHRLVIDLGRVPFIDSEGLEKLLAYQDQIRRVGGTIKLVNPTPLCHEILEVTRMSGYFDLYFDLEKAAGSFL